MVEKAAPGGWGYLLGDEGSGYWLGREAIAAYLQVLEGRRAAGCARRAESRRRPGTQTVPEGIAWVNSGANPVARLAGLAPLVASGSRRQAMKLRARFCVGRAGRWPISPLPRRASDLAQRGPGSSPCGVLWRRLGGRDRAQWRRFVTRSPIGCLRATITPPLLPPVAGAVAAGHAKTPDAAVLDNLIQAFANWEGRS